MTLGYMSLFSPETLGDNLRTCLKDVKCWMSQNFLKLNDEKSEIIAIGLTNSIIQVHSKQFFVIFDADLCFDAQVRNAVQSCFYQLKKISSFRPFA